MNKLFAICCCLFLILDLTELRACSCDGQNTIHEELDHSKFVFSGVVISRTLATNLSDYGVKTVGDTTDVSLNWLNYPTAVYEIKVNQIYKGRFNSDTVIVFTPPSGGSCGVSFSLGNRYIIYGTSEDEILLSNKVKRISSNNKSCWTHLCTRTNEFSKDDESHLIQCIRKK